MRPADSGVVGTETEASHENLVFAATCQNLFGADEGLAALCSPEEILVESTKVSLFVAELGLDRLRWLRNELDVSA